MQWRGRCNHFKTTLSWCNESQHCFATSFLHAERPSARKWKGLYLYIGWTHLECNWRILVRPAYLDAMNTSTASQPYCCTQNVHPRCNGWVYLCAFGGRMCSAMQSFWYVQLILVQWRPAPLCNVIAIHQSSTRVAMDGLIFVHMADLSGLQWMGTCKAKNQIYVKTKSTKTKQISIQYK